MNAWTPHHFSFIYLANLCNAERAEAANADFKNAVHAQDAHDRAAHAHDRRDQQDHERRLAVLADQVPHAELAHDAREEAHHAVPERVLDRERAEDDKLDRRGRGREQDHRRRRRGRHLRVQPHLQQQRALHHAAADAEQTRREPRQRAERRVLDDRVAVPDHVSLEVLEARGLQLRVEARDLGAKVQCRASEERERDRDQQPIAKASTGQADDARRAVATLRHREEHEAHPREEEHDQVAVGHAVAQLRELVDAAHGTTRADHALLHARVDERLVLVLRVAAHVLFRVHRAGVARDQRELTFLRVGQLLDLGVRGGALVGLPLEVRERHDLELLELALVRQQLPVGDDLRELLRVGRAFLSPHLHALAERAHARLREQPHDADCNKPFGEDRVHVDADDRAGERHGLHHEHRLVVDQRAVARQRVAAAHIDDEARDRAAEDRGFRQRDGLMGRQSHEQDVERHEQPAAAQPRARGEHIRDERADRARDLGVREREELVLLAHAVAADRVLEPERDAVGRGLARVALVDIEHGRVVVQDVSLRLSLDERAVTRR